MIETPRRSVTRFFIPLIDVLILLFCIFLLMPFVSRRDDEPAGPGGEAAAQEVAPTPEQMREEIDRLRARVRQLQKRQLSVSESLSVLVLEIDKRTGELFYYDPERDLQRQVIRSEAEARRLIGRHQRRSGTREPYFLILYPRELSGYPLQEQIDRYRRWFRDVAYGFNNPQALATAR